MRDGSAIKVEAQARHLSPALIGMGVVSVLLLGWAWYALSGTPQYSLYRLARAIVKQDLESAERYLDTQRMAEQVGEIFAQSGRAAMSRQLGQGQSSPYTGTVAEGLIEMMIPAIKARAQDEFRSELRRAIEGGDLNSRFLTLPEGYAGVRRRTEIRRLTPNNTMAMVIAFNESGQVVGQYRLVRSGRLWKIVGYEAVWLIRQLGLANPQWQSPAFQPAPPPSASRSVEDVVKTQVENVIGLGTVRKVGFNPSRGVVLVTFESATFNPNQSRDDARQGVTMEATLVGDLILPPDRLTAAQPILRQVGRIHLTIVSGTTILATATKIRNQQVHVVFADPRPK